MSAFIVCYPVV